MSLIYIFMLLTQVVPLINEEYIKYSLNSWERQESNLWLLGERRKSYLSATLTPKISSTLFTSTFSNCF